jgi:hypothetical protein
MTYANPSRPSGANNSVPISGAVLGVAGIGAGVLLGLRGMQVSTEAEIAPVLDTAEEAGASYEDLSRLEALIRNNVQRGVEVVFGTEYGTGTMGQYDPELNQILITPETLDMGLEDSLATIKTLLHETTHAHQDAIDGLDNASMGTVGIDANAQGLEYVEENYSGLDPHTHALEVEANSSEYQIDQSFDHLGIDL